MKLCVVIPAYNEAARLPSTLEGLAHAQASKAFAPLELSEVIIVNDGSSDETAEVAARGPSSLSSLVRVMSSPRNFGKGHAVRSGVLAATADWVLVADADQSTPWDQFQRLWKALQHEGEIAMGSRSLVDSQVSRRQTWIRQTMGKTFNMIVRLFTQLPFKDTQCGFKLFHREKTALIFEKARVNRFAWDVEILMWAERLGLWTAEVPVQWEHKDASRVRIVHDSLEMLAQVIRTRVRFLFTRQTLDVWGIGFVLLSAMALIPVVTSLGLFDLDEALYRHVASQMKATGQVWNPQWDGEPFHHKPPFLYWLMMFWSGFLGDGPQEISIVAARLSSWGATFVTGLCLAWTWPFLYRRLPERWAGARSPFFPAFLFSLALWPGVAGATVLFDPLQTCLLTPALLAGTWYFLDGEKRSPSGIGWVVFGVSCAAGVAVKGFQALVVPGLSFALMSGLMALIGIPQGGSRTGFRSDLRFGAQALAVAVGTLAIVFTWLDVEMGRAFTKEFFIEQHLNRAGRAFEGHAGFPGFYLVVVFLGGGALTWLLSGLSRTWGRGALSVRSYPTTWILSFLVFFSFVATKLPNYIWPIWPAFALGVALAVANRRAVELERLPRLVPGVVALLLILIFGAVGLVAFGVWDLPSRLPNGVTADVLFSSPIRFGILSLGVGALVLGLGTFAYRSFRSRAGAAVVAQVLFVGGSTLGLMPGVYALWSGATETLVSDALRPDGTSSPECLELVGPRSAVFSHAVQDHLCSAGHTGRLIAPVWKQKECETRGLRVLSQKGVMILCGTR